jgi:8-oxo-dGTP pyrophosphatase MutT (NUDIX family)
MAHVTAEVLARAEALLGSPAERVWRYPIRPQEMQMVVSSTRGQTRLHDVTLFIFNPAGQIALIRKHGYPPGAWRAPGGGVAPGEPFIDGAAREALEETGLSVTLTRYLLRVKVLFTCGELEQPWTTHVVIAQAGEGEPVTRDPKEIESVAWGSVADLCGPIARAMLTAGSGLFTYRVAIHREVARLLGLWTPADSSN